jgi:hypothetical protein
MIDPNCKTCGGDGFVYVSAPVYANEPHMADIMTEVCDCQGDGIPDYDLIIKDGE